MPIARPASFTVALATLALATPAAAAPIELVGPGGGEPALSASGRFTAFVTPDGGIARHDAASGATLRISPAGLDPSISANGRYVAFETNDNSLVPNDTNVVECSPAEEEAGCEVTPATDVFVHDTRTGKTRLVSRSTRGPQGDNSSVFGDISANGRYVTFSSDSTNLVRRRPPQGYGVYVRDLKRGTTRLVSGRQDGFISKLSARGTVVAFTSGDRLIVRDLRTGDRDVIARGGAPFDLSDDGRRIVYVTGALDLFVRDLDAGATSQVGEDARLPAISGDGRVVAFQSDSQPVGTDGNNGLADVFVRDLETDALTVASVAADGTPGDSYSVTPALDRDGSVIAFQSNAANLVAGDGNGQPDLFRTRTHGQT